MEVQPCIAKRLTELEQSCGRYNNIRDCLPHCPCLTGRSCLVKTHFLSLEGGYIPAVTPGKPARCLFRGSNGDMNKPSRGPLTPHLSRPSQSETAVMGAPFCTFLE